MTLSNGIREALTGCLAIGLLVSAARAGTVNYTGAAGGDFEAGGNWQGGSAPADNLTGDTASFADTAPNLSRDRSILGLTFSGYTTLGGAHILRVGAGGAAVSSRWVEPAINANLSLDADSIWSITNNSSLTCSGTLGGIGKLALFGNGSLILSGAGGGYDGTLDVTGILRIDNANALGSGVLQVRNGGCVGTMNVIVPNAVIFTGGSVTLGLYGVAFSCSGPVTLMDSITFNHASFSDADFSGTIGESGGSRSITNNGSAGYTLILSGNNTFSGGVVLNSGICYANSAGALGPGTLVLRGGTVGCSSGTRVITNAVRIEADSGLGTYGAGEMDLRGPVTLAGSCRITAPSWHTDRISGNIGDGEKRYGLTVSHGGGGSNSLILSGTNTFSGTLHVLQGLVRLDSDGALARAAKVSIDSGGKLRLGADYKVDALTLGGVVKEPGIYNCITDPGYFETTAPVRSLNVVPYRVGTVVCFR